ncbi:MAG TPA: UDP-4-amino-4,6-dideoxy-N-acetyl-beta-L-altrosamine transaminase [Cryomorphaceae bacterium]|nr:UDP-4-amino-4,6-dideoxy-N-acetyl-beta-L-altrosamine transaminase [Owenweeksia sp.]MBF98485.1 UDP-4-amino-4,6-dideoxy-N-acetyl-beta-L-altrosamine transaminase [Owenweeksia sp.]HAD96954.1 UDP-4-amino-4,6-dideoxy-N-acetyl-beta-L-altrosamine transaminase [Cryomorphaceae bacterium]|tara:strand:+ start:202 stop:1356 length:1155 start_codon:yes stop_codon:yes gene_type:complete
MKNIPYGRQEITKADEEAVLETLRSDFLTQGPKIAEFEKAFAEYVGSQYAVAVSNGTAALHLCAMALGVKPGDKVITTPITFAASANCIKYCGGEVAFADIDPETFLMDIAKVKELLESHPKGTFKGIVPVDFTGFPVNLEGLRALADEYDLWIIEDACHAPGAYFMDSNHQKQLCGNGRFAELAIFSFHPVKHIAAGEGGMITTNDEALYQKLLMLRTHGITKDPSLLEKNEGGWYYEMQDLGYNYRITDFQAALGLSQLGRAEANLEKRRDIAHRYDKAFAGTSIGLQEQAQEYSNAFHLYVIRVNDRKGLYDHLRENGIYAQVHYIPVHTLPYYRQFGWKEGDLPLAEKYYSECLSLPMYPSLTAEDQQYVIDRVLEFVDR